MIYSNDKIIVHQKDSLQYIEFSNLKKYHNMLTHCFTTRLGGVSTGECASLNLSFNRNDLRENVLANYHIIAEAIGVDFDKMVLSNQVHDKRIWYVEEADAGKGLTRESNITGYDGLTTNIPGIPLVTFYADCVPVIILDPVKKAVTSIHSGWKSTLLNISLEGLKMMKDRYNSNMKDLQVAVGPSICKSCFEVGEEVYQGFIGAHPWCGEFIESRNGKYYIDLQRIIRRELTNGGVDPANILISDVCTKCNHDMFFSYRGDKAKTGSLAAIVMLK